MPSTPSPAHTPFFPSAIFLAALCILSPIAWASCLRFFVVTSPTGMEWLACTVYLPAALLVFLLARCLQHRWSICLAYTLFFTLFLIPQSLLILQGIIFYLQLNNAQANRTHISLKSKKLSIRYLKNILHFLVFEPWVWIHLFFFGCFLGFANEPIYYINDWTALQLGETIKNTGGVLSLAAIIGFIISLITVACQQSWVRAGKYFLLLYPLAFLFIPYVIFALMGADELGTLYGVDLPSYAPMDGTIYYDSFNRPHYR